MRRRRDSKIAVKGKMFLFIVVAGLILAVAVMLLWNWLMPVIFGLTTITFWQALGLLALSKILFGRGGRRGGQQSERSNRYKEHFMKRFEKNKGSRSSINIKKEDSDEKR